MAAPHVASLSRQRPRRPRPPPSTARQHRGSRCLCHEFVACDACQMRRTLRVARAAEPRPSGRSHASSAFRFRVRNTLDAPAAVIITATRVLERHQSAVVRGRRSCLSNLPCTHPPTGNAHVLGQGPRRTYHHSLGPLLSQTARSRAFLDAYLYDVAPADDFGSMECWSEHHLNSWWPHHR